METVLTCAGLALLAGCADPAAPPPAIGPAAPSPPPAPPAASALSPVDLRWQIQLPFSTTRAPVPPTLPTVLISRRAIVVRGDDASLIPLPPDQAASGADAAYKRNGRNDLYLVPLAAALARAARDATGALAIGADAGVPYRVLLGVLFTASQSQYPTFHFLTRTSTGFGSIETHVPKIRGSALVGPAMPTLNLTLLMTAGGLSVKAAGESIAPGCAGIGPGLTFPRGPGGVDLTALSACAASLRQKGPSFASETQAVVVPSSDVPFGEIVAVMDALRVEPSGRVGFPDIAFGVGPR